MTASPTPATKTIPAARTLPPAVLWAALGTIYLLFAAWAMGQWIVFGRLDLRAGGDYALSNDRKAVLWAAQGAIAVAIAGVITWNVRQCRRERRLTFDAALTIAYLTALWIGPVMNLGQHGVLYNRYLIHTPSWGPYIPGWRSPAGHQQIETVLCSGLGFIAGIVWIHVIATAIRLLVLRHRPQLTGLRFVLAATATAILISLPLDAAWLLTGAFAFADSLPALTLFADQWYQLPLYKMALTAILLGLVPYLVWYSQQTRGPESAILRGIGNVPRRARTTVQILAAIGLVHSCLLVFGPVNWLVSLATHGQTAGTFPFPFDHP
ncbi:spirocyclase AveC family protein [Streptomyces syringium]|uniref:spirocyclase AveC family protein n=1 Tax=Streptomyces syringium TaxID=76729 RepID=UPI00345344A6